MGAWLALRQASWRVFFASQAPAGWQYDPSCCAGVDCYQAPPSDLKDTVLALDRRTNP
ncbi:hypothetical protein MPLDJ20_310029 [Mesorhizobium plurifarium]|uniref:Uncharacterized protein n=1 Tax=Mesorhizobium plurifarium TaxID=69974 RepID=A0A090FAT7_MESPL|nr:hypothetical protein MPLDJ20_310029 [Mesorhizobium plurifarium]